VVFLSFSSKDKAFADRTHERLKEVGFDVWYSNRSIEAGGNYAKDIVSAIQSSQCLVLLYSESSGESVHVQRELDLALRYKKPIFPLRIENIEPQEAMEYWLSGCQYVDLFENGKENFEKFIAHLKKQIGAKDDKTKKLDAQNIQTFALQHFKEMGYEVHEKGSVDWAELIEVKAHLRKNPNWSECVLNYLEANCFHVKKDNISIIVNAKILENPRASSYFKTLEADLFWEARKILWNEDELKKVLKDLKKPEVLIEEENIDFRFKSILADKFRHKTPKNLSLLFYLFVKTPPKFEPKTYSMPLVGKYQEGEQMPSLYLNYSLFPSWWGLGKDDIEGIKGGRYIGFAKAFETIRYDAKLQSSVDYENYDGRIAETLAEVFLSKNELVVQKFGAENVLGNSISFIQKTSVLEDINASDTIKRFMTSPDLFVIKLNDKNEMINAYLMDVKYRSYANSSLFEKAVQKGGDLYRQAQKYQSNWNNVYLFMFIHVKDENSLAIYIESVSDILSQKKFTPLEKNSSFRWLDSDTIKELHVKASSIWN